MQLSYFTTSCFWRRNLTQHRKRNFEHLEFAFSVFTLYHVAFLTPQLDTTPKCNFENLDIAFPTLKLYHAVFPPPRLETTPKTYYCHLAIPRPTFRFYHGVQAPQFDTTSSTYFWTIGNCISNLQMLPIAFRTTIGCKSQHVILKTWKLHFQHWYYNVVLLTPQLDATPNMHFFGTYGHLISNKEIHHVAFLPLQLDTTPNMQSGTLRDCMSNIHTPMFCFRRHTWTQHPKRNCECLELLFPTVKLYHAVVHL